MHCLMLFEHKKVVNFLAIKILDYLYFNEMHPLDLEIDRIVKTSKSNSVNF